MRALLAYFIERVRPGLFVPVVAALWLNALWASEALDVRTFTSELASLEAAGSTYALPLLLLTLLVLQFRLWDDLEDRERDRQFHPDRVLVRSRVEPFRWWLAALTAAALVAAAATNFNVLAGVAALDAWFLVAYRVIRPHVTDLVWRFPILLAKYPAFATLTAVAVGGVSGRRLALSTLVVMTGACVYEATHHGQQPAGVAS
jgi:4-hydroxybenzoate polyprenyltransferase